MKKRILYFVSIAFLITMFLGGLWIWRLQTAVSFFCDREDVVVDRYPCGMIRYLEFKSGVTDEDVTQLRRLYLGGVYPLTHLYFNGVEFRNNRPIPEIPTLEALVLIGPRNSDGASNIDAISLGNLLKGKNLEDLTFVDHRFLKRC